MYAGPAFQPHQSAIRCLKCCLSCIYKSSWLSCALQQCQQGHLQICAPSWLAVPTAAQLIGSLPECLVAAVSRAQNCGWSGGAKYAAAASVNSRSGFRGHKTYETEAPVPPPVPECIRFAQTLHLQKLNAAQRAVHVAMTSAADVQGCAKRESQCCA